MIDTDTILGTVEDLMESQDVLMQIFASTEGARALLVEAADESDRPGVEQSIQLLEIAGRRLQREVFPILRSAMSDLVSPRLSEVAELETTQEAVAN